MNDCMCGAEDCPRCFPQLRDRSTPEERAEYTPTDHAPISLGDGTYIVSDMDMWAAAAEDRCYGGY